MSQAKGNDVWQAYKYTKSCKVKKLPPIQSDSGPQINFDGKCNAFIKAKYPKPPEIDLGQEADTAPRLEPWIEVTDKEIQNAIFTSSPKKAPGPDLLAFRIIQQAYKTIPGILNMLYTTILRHRYHPTSWHQGIGAILKKSGDRDSQLPVIQNHHTPQLLGKGS